MPRKTKEQKDLEESKKIKKNTTRKSKVKTESKSDLSKKTVAKKATTKKDSTAEKATAKKAATTKKAVEKKATTKRSSTTKKAATKKATTAKKADTKKVATKKGSTVKKASVTKKTTKKTSTKKEEALIDKTLAVAEYYDLPYRYNKTVVKILAQTPSTLFVYWEISDNDIENYKKVYGDNFFEITRPILIVHNETLGYSFEVDINDFANSWYLRVNNAKCDYKIELGRRPIENNDIFVDNYIHIATSNDIVAPNDHILGNISSFIKFRNVKNNNEFTKMLSELKISKNMSEIYDIYKLIYQDENISDLTNPSSGSFSSTFK